ncbi:low choriolytic enzyme-like isoform X2 [Xyrauchen texanus]|uniref:low choriolytic enzyme-like isoform X2 n=1 Tax=Xyrauchen texanus TaxID=154827 RepID=UPI002241D3BA|nr:low choriolytic enzyme-like isoform X2 [Xyrauchen texanus]
MVNDPFPIKMLCADSFCRFLAVMFGTKMIFGLLALLLVSSVRAEEMGFSGIHHMQTEDTSAELSVSELLHRANKGIIPEADEPELLDDIAVNERNADPCTSTDCLWPTSADGHVYIPYVIADNYSSREVDIIQRALDSFSSVSCIRFFPRNDERDYISIESRSGCYSYVGRQGYGQIVSLASSGCIYHSTVQHELLHALGFNHEQTRSDRDDHIQVIWENILDDKKHNFDKINTLNQGTPYDYNSVMQYERYAFSKNGLATMVPIPDSSVEIGTATEMSQNDMTRLFRLYKCKHIVATDD